MKKDPSDILQQARKAFAEKNYKTALNKYHWFFDNALKIDKSYYGVRLSYCLSEWADLGALYPPALKALCELKKSSLKIFEENQLHSQFHEYSSICDALGCPSETVETFLEVASADQELANKLFKFVYAELAKNSRWDICREYIGNGYNQYKEILELFDACIEGAGRIGKSQNEGIVRSSIEKTIEELLWLLNMQAHANVKGEIEAALSRIEHDFTKRGYVEVFERVMENVPNR